jgi:cyclopropane-fatty-acyl-phospholipid synthase
MLLARCLSRVIRIGRLELVDAAGQHHVFGGTPGPSVTVRLHDKSLHWKLIVNPRLNVPEAYMDGTLTIEDGDIYALI